MSGYQVKPTRADHRLIRKLLDTFYAGKVVHTPESYDLVVDVFARAGGSWERVFKGSVEDLTLLKRTLKQAFKSGRIPRSAPFR